MEVKFGLQPGEDAERGRCISRCKPLHMMYISASQHQPNTVYDEVKEFLEVDLETVHAAISFVSSDTEATMMSWNQVQRATQADGTLLRLMDHIYMW
jgi:hypothetical protein